MPTAVGRRAELALGADGCSTRIEGPVWTRSRSFFLRGYGTAHRCLGFGPSGASRGQRGNYERACKSIGVGTETTRCEVIGPVQPPEITRTYPLAEGIRVTPLGRIIPSRWNRSARAASPP